MSHEPLLNHHRLIDIKLAQLEAETTYYALRSLSELFAACDDDASISFYGVSCLLAVMADRCEPLEIDGLK